VSSCAVEEGDLGEGAPAALIRLLRRTAAQQGCDGLVIAPPGSKSQTGAFERTESYRVYSGTCIVYATPAAR
jgi:hypothetical protein